MIAFIEEYLLEENEIRDFASQMESFDFWENKAEYIYQDYFTYGQNIIQF